jgi:lycopene cyclase domain-containing protein
MKSEYLLFNVLVLAGPLALSFDKKVYFKQYWPFAFPAMIIGSLPHVIWDILATGHFWTFNPEYVLGFRLGPLPLEEILFFIMVPYAVLFTWEVFRAYFTSRTISAKRGIIILIITGFGSAVFFAAFFQWYYTALVFFAFSIVLFVDYHLLHENSVWYQSLWYRFLLIFIVMVLIANGYLTARPVVEYVPLYRSSIRIWTIPIEDFLFGLSHVALVVTLYTFLKNRKSG